MTRVIHTGDTHIGYQQYHSPERREDFIEAFRRVVADAVEDDVDAVVHAGDLFHDRRPELRDLLGTLSALRELAAADVPFLAVVGNHESTRGGQWLDLFERLGLAIRLGREPTVVGDTAFYGLDHVPRSRRDDLAYDFAPHDAAHAALVAHGLFTPFAHADWETETVLGASPVDFDAMLLGDNHTPDTATVGETWVTYPGSTERASAAERDGRGYNLVTFADGAVDIRRRSLETRPFVFVSVDLAPGEGTERVREQVRQHDLADAVVIVEVTGEGDPVPPAEIETFATEAGALVARVTDRRELDAGADGTEVHFADPDEAVRERVAELGLSSAAVDIDRTVRTGKTADSNVRETVKERVADLLDEDPGAFEPASPTGEEGDEAPDGTTGTEPDDESEEVTADGESEEVTADEAVTEATTEEAAEEEATEEATDEAATDGPAVAEDGTDGDGPDADEPRTDRGDAGGDGQVSMEDFL